MKMNLPCAVIWNNRWNWFKKFMLRRKLHEIKQGANKLKRKPWPQKKRRDEKRRNNVNEHWKSFDKKRGRSAKVWFGIKPQGNGKNCQMRLKNRGGINII